MSKVNEVNYETISPDSKEFKEVEEFIYGMIEKTSTINSVDLTTEAVKKFGKAKYPEVTTTFLEPAIMKRLKKVDVTVLSDIKGFEKVSFNLGKCVGVINDISTAEKYSLAWQDMAKCKKIKEDLVKLDYDIDHAPDAETANILRETKKRLEHDSNEILRKSGKALIGAISGVVSKIPYLGSVYSTIISKTGDLLDNAYTMITSHNATIDEYIKIALGQNVTETDLFKKFKTLDEFSEYYDKLKKLKESGVMNIMNEGEKNAFEKKLREAEAEYNKAKRKIKTLNNILRDIGDHRRRNEKVTNVFEYDPDKGLKKARKGKEDANQPYDPLVVDLKNDGFEILGLKDGTHFDLDGDKLKEKTSWTSNSDGFLSIDLDGNGKIDNGAELFGDSFLLADGTYASPL